MSDRILDLPASVFAALRAHLDAADALRLTDGVIDLRGVAVRSRGGDDGTVDLTVTSLLSAASHDGRVELALNGELLQMDLPKAREVVDMLQDAIEAAVSDALLFAFLTTRIGLEPERAGMALLDFRELRQGARGRVHPS